MKLILLAIFLSLLIHIIPISIISIEKKQNEDKKTNENQTKITYVKLEKKTEMKPEVKKQIKDVKPKKIPIEKKVIQEVKKKEIKKPIVKEKKTAEKPKQKKVDKVLKKEAKKLQNTILQEQIVNKTNSIQNKTLEDFLSQEDTKQDKETLNYLQKMYGKEYETLTNLQKVYLKKNINHFRRITQRVLNRMGYPPIAKKLKLAGENIVSFYFHPNGDISDLKITTNSKYELFDDYTLEMIEIAYKDYPKPKTKTKIVFNVRYIIY